MRRQLVGAALRAVLVAVLIVLLPSIALLVICLGQEGVRDWITDHMGWAMFGLGGILVLLSAAAVAAGVTVAGSHARRLAEPMRELAERAERLGAGESRFTPLVTGIEEIDRVSTVLSRSAQQLTKSLASERDFASDASHQLRTPLTALLMRLEEISVTDDPQVVKEEANVAIDQVLRLTKVVDDLLLRTRRAHEAPPPEVSLDSVIAALQREWQPAFESARRSVRVHGERGLMVKATPVALSQVLSTLLENALAHGRGTVDVHARRSGPSVVVEVTDQGDGVSAAIAPHIFERSVSSAKSTGLGLALARDLAESNGGRLELVQTQPAIFALFLSEAESVALA